MIQLLSDRLHAARNEIRMTQAQLDAVRRELENARREREEARTQLQRAYDLIDDLAAAAVEYVSSGVARVLDLAVGRFT